MKLSIIMYHYVRDLSRSRFPEIKGLEMEQFKEQILYIKKHYNVISGYDLLAASEARSFESLPTRALLLSFDDGYIDHFLNVFPTLIHEKLTGCFFPPAMCVLDNKVLDVNKIHFVLANVLDKRLIVNDIIHLMDEYGGKYRIHSKEYYWEKLTVSGRYDSAEVIFIKRILQRELPDDLRSIIINILFKKYVTSDEYSGPQK